MKKYLSIFLVCFLLFSFASPAFASNYPDLPSYVSGDYYVIGQNPINLKTYLVFWNPNDPITYYQKSNELIFNGDDPDNGRYSISVYTLLTGDDGNYWGDAYGITVGGAIGNKSVYINPIYEGNVLIYNQDGTVFFSPPQLLQVGLLEVEMTPLVEQVAGTMMTLIPYGVLCLALLVSLPLLLKVFRKFLP